ncbi:MAG: 3-ketoacyl-ACP reductase [Cyclobacteriaceae bacterium]
MAKEGKYALVTGGTRGIGLGIAVFLAKEGYHIAVNGVRPEAAVEEAIAELSSYNVKVIYCQGNIGDANDRKSIVEKIKAEFGQLNVLVNNAGVAPKTRFDLLETTEDSYDFVMDINLKGTFFLTQTLANMMVGQPAPTEGINTIVNVSSISATTASVNRGEYCMSKAGMGMMTSLFAVRLAKNNIPVYEIRPGLIETDMTSGVKEKYDKMIAEGLTLQPRWGQPDDIGKVVATLASGNLAYSTGQVIHVDGGIVIPRL